MHALASYPPLARDRGAVCSMRKGGSGRVSSPSSLPLGAMQNLRVEEAPH